MLDKLKNSIATKQTVSCAVLPRENTITITAVSAVARLLNADCIWYALPVSLFLYTAEAWARKRLSSAVKPVRGNITMQHSQKMLLVPRF